MTKDSDSWSRRYRSLLFTIGWVIAVAGGIALLWLGFELSKGATQPAEVEPSATTAQETVAATATLPPLTPSNTPAPTDTPLPTSAPEPTPIPPTPTLTRPRIVAGANGVNVRTGPGLNYTRLGYLEPGAEAEVIGRYGDWWQIRYNGAPGWVFGDIVTASNTDGVAQVEPPPSPTPAPATATPAPTAVPPTATPANFRGLVPDDYQVEGAPGRYGVGQKIWFHMWITNKTGTAVEYKALGTWVEETGQFQQSYTYSEFAPGEHFHWRDHIDIPAPGEYHLWMTVCFLDGECVNMLGPVTVVVQ